MSGRRSDASVTKTSLREPKLPLKAAAETFGSRFGREKAHKPVCGPDQA